MRRLWVFAALLLLSPLGFAQSSEQGRNLRACMSGYAALCDHTQLTPTEAVSVASAEHDRNLRTCLSGYSALCDHGLLTTSEAQSVAIAEHERNLRTCLSGYSALCDHALLTSSEANSVRVAEHDRNLSVCTSNYNGLCDRNLLTPTEASKIVVPPPNPPSALTPGVAENGSYYGEPNKNGVPKTVHVDGYYRKNGTYVRGHYRSAPGTNPK